MWMISIGKINSASVISQYSHEMSSPELVYDKARNYVVYELESRVHRFNSEKTLFFMYCYQLVKCITKIQIG